MLIGNRVCVYRLDGEMPFTGIMQNKDETGILVSRQEGYDDERLLIPWANLDRDWETP